MSITTKYELPLSEIMENVKKEIEALDPENTLEEFAQNEWKDLYDQLNKAHSQVLRLELLYSKDFAL